MKKSVFLYFVVAFVMAAASTILWAYPGSIKCPTDGEYMFFDQKVGYGSEAVCWYKHKHTDFDAQGAHTVTHTAYIPCPD
jgi:hypothetical protein